MSGSLQARLASTVYVPPVPFPAWNPADKNAAITLSNANHTATGSGGSFTSVRGTVSKAAGKWYFQTVLGGVAGVTGLALATASLASYIGVDPDGYGYGYGGNVVNAAGIVRVTTPYVAGDIVMIAYDAAGTMWVGLNGVWNGNPSAGTGGIGITPGTYFPGGSAESVTDSVTLQTPSYTLPTGFSTWA